MPAIRVVFVSYNVDLDKSLFVNKYRFTKSNACSMNGYGGP